MKTHLAWGNISDRIVLTLEEHGRCTTSELADLLDYDMTKMRSVLARLRKVQKRGPYAGTRRIYIAGWVYDAEGEREYPRAVYARGPGRDVPKPAPKPREVLIERYKEKMRVRRASTSVFNFGKLVAPYAARPFRGET